MADEIPPAEFPTAKTLTGERFQLGDIVVTKNAETRLVELFGGEEGQYGWKIAECLARHMKCDWGEVDEHDKQVNDEAIAHEGDPDLQGRIMSVYTLSGVTFWIITEKDRSVTSIVMPEDY